MSLYIWATFVRIFVTKNFLKNRPIWSRWLSLFCLYTHLDIEEEMGGLNLFKWTRIEISAQSVRGLKLIKNSA